MNAIRQALAYLLPQGSAWPRDPDSVWMRLLGGVAASLSELHEFTLQTAREWLPHLTRTRLAEWEAATGLPDPCFSALQTDEERRNAVLARLRGYEGAYDDSSPAAPGAIAAHCALLGQPASAVVYNTPFRVGRDRVGRRLGKLDGKLFITVEGEATPFRVGVNRVGDRLIERPPEVVELACALERVVPARFGPVLALGSPVSAVPDQLLSVGVSYLLELNSYWPAGAGPFVWSVVSGLLPAGVSLDSATGVLSGTPLVGAVYADVVFRRVGAYGPAKDSNAVDFTVSADASFASVMLLLGGDGSLADSSSYHRTPAVVGAIASAADASAFGGESIRCFSGTTPNHATFTAAFAAAADLYTLDFWYRINDSVGTGAGFAGDRGEFLRMANTAATTLITANGLVNTAGTHAFGITGGVSVNRAAHGLAADTDRVFVRVVRENAGGFTSLFFNGRFAFNGSHTAAVDSIRVGSPGNATCSTGAYVEELRFTKGVARSVRGLLNPGDVAFAVPTSPFPRG